MEIWILVVALLAIGILFLLASLFTGRESSLDEQINDLAVSQSEELYQIKSRLQVLEQAQYDHGTKPQTPSSFDALNQADHSSSEENQQVSDNDMEEIIRLYTQGYTMHEISQAVHKNVETVQVIIDDYIENR